MISMLITTYGRAELLKASLARLEELTLPDEIIVVEDGSDGTKQVEATCQWARERMNALGGFPLRYVFTDNPGLTQPCHARNVALKLAEGDEIVVSEPEVIFLTDVVAQLVAARGQHPEAVLREERGYWVNAYRRQWLLDVGGWDEALPSAHEWDDIDLYERLARCGHPHLPLPEIEVEHQWHPSRVDPGASEDNRRYVESKVFPRDLVANQGKEWGVIK